MCDKRSVCTKATLLDTQSRRAQLPPHFVVLWGSIRDGITITHDIPHAHFLSLRRRCPVISTRKVQATKPSSLSWYEKSKYKTLSDGYHTSQNCWIKISKREASRCDPNILQTCWTQSSKLNTLSIWSEEVMKSQIRTNLKSIILLIRTLASRKATCL